MARIRWHGTEYAAVPVQELSNGDWLMRTLEHGARFTVGTMIQVKKADIVTLEDGDAPDPAARAAEIEAAMKAEREAIPTVEDLLQKFKEKNDATAEPAP